MTRADLYLLAKPLLPKFLRNRLRLLYWKLYSRAVFKDWHMFQSVSIEISVYCNRTCSYCPNTDHKTPREFMSDAVFSKVLDRLWEVRWPGIVDFIFYNEPLLDPTLEQKVRAVKDAAPDCLPRITTNGDALTEDKLRRLVDAGVVSFYVTRHVPSDKRWDDRINALASKYPRHVTVTDIREVEEKVGLWNRAGLVKVKKEYKTASCRAPEGSLNIDRHGNVLLCCCDYFHAHKMGNVREQSLLKIWSGERFARIRAKLRRGVAELEICKNCILRTSGEAAK